METLFIGLGGAGSNIVSDIRDELSGLDYCRYLTIDTSNANAKEGIPFTHLKKDSNKDELLTGSGGIRGKNLNDVKQGVLKFVDDEKLYTFTGVLYLVFSTNGGSGNIIASLMLQELLNKNVSVCCIMVHDTTSKQYAIQSKDTLESLYGIAKKNLKAVPTIYYLNDKINITQVNNTIKKEIRTIVEYNDIANIVDIDAEDIRNFYKPSIYTKLGIPAGIYGITALNYGSVENIVKNYNVLIGRTLTNSDTDPLADANILQYKKGTNTRFNSESMLILINNFEKHHTLLRTHVESYTDEVKMFEIEVTDSEDGLVL